MNLDKLKCFLVEEYDDFIVSESEEKAISYLNKNLESGLKLTEVKHWHKQTFDEEQEDGSFRKTLIVTLVREVLSRDYVENIYVTNSY